MSGREWIRADRPGAGPAPDPEGGLLLLGPEGAPGGALGREDRVLAAELGRHLLREAGVVRGDRVAVALSAEGDQTGALVAEAATAAGAQTAVVGPRGRMRLHAALEAMGATVLVATPCGAADLLARLHLEFQSDPLDLGLRRILLAGEVAPDTVRRRLASEFGAEVGDLFIDPLLQVPVAHRPLGAEGFAPASPGTVGLAPLDADTIYEPPYPAGTAEIVTVPDWHPALRGTVVRTGFTAEPEAGADAVPVPSGTVGDRVLVRGRWLPLPRLERELARVDGIGAWELRVSRPGTLDMAELRVAFARASLIGDRMWTARIEQALASFSPVRIAVAVEDEARDEGGAGRLTDERGHHLARERGGARARAG
ncbi:hypothetical protein O4J56_07540 [Nocardiopsis sp. RSe5-2]|uniref:AMP-dependent synthetase/ligase domain-containing protein n=1 Tax=Nocardiopsis endophytica TaxID=3018445 RepID=A0ABT4U1C5_9ACTN|nr:hypothetical protein [Nocardiopsis endophytica]MDA2810486.1 hypothetical protein [Nocardiopsis endophytica]